MLQSQLQSIIQYFCILFTFLIIRFHISFRTVPYMSIIYPKFQENVIDIFNIIHKSSKYAINFVVDFEERRNETLSLKLFVFSIPVQIVNHEISISR